jgi:hypothetical protein
VERVIGSLWCECLDHVIVWNERSLRRHLQRYFVYYHEWRTHLSLDKDAPFPRAAQSPALPRSSQSHRSAACITIMNVAPPDRRARRRHPAELPVVRLFSVHTQRFGNAAYRVSDFRSHVFDLNTRLRSLGWCGWNFQ